MNIYQNVIDEFLLTLPAKGISPQCAKVCISWFDKKKFITQPLVIAENPFQEVAVDDAVFLASIYENMQLLIDQLTLRLEGTTTSILNHIISLINAEHGDNTLFHDYPGRQKGVLYENILAKVLYGEAEGSQKEANVKILKAMASILIKMIAGEFDNWIKQPAAANERFKRIVKYEMTLLPASSSFFTQVLNLFGNSDFISQSALISKMEPEKIVRQSGISTEDLSCLAKNNRDEVLQAIHKFIPADNEGAGVFNHIARHPVVSQSLAGLNGNKELLMAKLFNSEKGLVDGVGLETVWPLLGAWAVKSICIDAAKYFDKNPELPN